MTITCHTIKLVQKKSLSQRTLWSCSHQLKYLGYLKLIGSGYNWYHWSPIRWDPCGALNLDVQDVYVNGCTVNGTVQYRDGRGTPMGRASSLTNYRCMVPWWSGAHPGDECLHWPPTRVWYRDGRGHTHGTSVFTDQLPRHLLPVYGTVMVPYPGGVQNRFQSPPLWQLTGLPFWWWSPTVKLTGTVFTFTVGGVTFTVSDETFTVGDEAYIGAHRTAPVGFVTDCKSYATNCKSENSACKFHSRWPSPERQSG